MTPTDRTFRVLRAANAFAADLGDAHFVALSAGFPIRTAYPGVGDFSIVPDFDGEPGGVENPSGGRFI